MPTVMPHLLTYLQLMRIVAELNIANGKVEATIKSKELLHAAVDVPVEQLLSDKVELTDLWRIAAYYIVGMVEFEPLSQWNIIVGFTAAVLFLEENGLRFIGSPEASTELMNNDNVTVDEIAEFFRNNTEKVSQLA